MTRSLISPTPPGYRLLSRELWPRGMVTRWRMTAPLPKGDTPPVPQQTVVKVSYDFAPTNAELPHGLAAIS